MSAGECWAFADDDADAARSVGQQRLAVPCLGRQMPHMKRACSLARYSRRVADYGTIRAVPWMAEIGRFVNPLAAATQGGQESE